VLFQGSGVILGLYILKSERRTVVMQLSEKEKDELYEEFKQKYEKECINNRRTLLADERIAFAKKWSEIMGLDIDEHRRPSCITGWNVVTGFVSRCMGARLQLATSGDEEFDEKAIELARKLSDLYFEYYVYNLSYRLRNYEI
jgi:hypothetical protein